MEWTFEGRAGICRLVIGEPLAGLRERLAAHRLVIVADAAVRARHGAAFPDAPVIELTADESRKSLATVEALYEQFADLGLDRESWVLGIGGGITGDVAGFAAATYLRGVPFALAPTTLLAQVDAGVGGKTGVNFRGRKNLIGAFRQPRLVWCDPAVLRTLPPRETLSGLAEAIKHALIADPQLFAFFERHVQPLLALEAEVVNRVVRDCLRIKLDFVQRDELEEAGPRRALNFGHTLGHAIEVTVGAPHGIAVAWGMAAAARLSVARGLLPAADAQRLSALLCDFGFPPPPALDREQILAAARDDKKRRGEKLRFVLLARLGEATVVELEASDLAAAWDALWEN